ncbi:GerAB/ArcD/ProY family transporter [Paenibacillus tarimensis]|uniref:GerAB/ArcD/ProY family transporter n=1 Tax=Paenibacillus tarimensis TaxID=416012 RepID=UPI001F3D667A|nr:endospore germination permease [Paenibacillus tarimensis]MCF2943040.1 endospore germination permease [Paenibacillus tarimensis]
MERLSKHQVLLIGVMYSFASTNINVQAQSAYHVKQHLWLAQIIPAVLILLVLWLLSHVMKEYPDNNLFQIFKIKFPKLGRLLIVCYILFFFYIMFRDIRMTSDFINTALLPRTPLILIGSLMAYTVVLIARDGIVPLARMTELFGFSMLTIVFLLPLLFVGDLQWINLLPITEVNWEDLFTGTWYLISYTGEIIGIFFLATYRSFQFRTAALALGVALYQLLNIALLTLLVLGAPILGRVVYPSFELVRHIHLTDFLDRMDLPMVGIYMPSLIIKIGYSLVIVCMGLKELSPKISGRMMTAPVGFLAFAFSFWFYESLIQMLNFNRTWTTIALLFEVLIPLLVFPFFVFKRKLGVR